MDQKQEALLGLPLTNAEREWLTDRLETLSVKESYQLSAAIMRSGRLQELVGKNRDELQATVLQMKPDVAVEAINRPGETMGRPVQPDQQGVGALPDDPA